MMQPGTTSAGDPRQQREQRSALTGSTHESVPATAVVISGAHRQRKRINKYNILGADESVIPHTHNGARSTAAVEAIVEAVSLSD
jgi:hypothetical protein